MRKRFCMKLILFASYILLLSACGLKYTPPETREEVAADRKSSVTKYIRDAYKDSSVVYQSIVFAQPTVIKPFNHRQLDSLYEIKFENEQRGRFDRALEEKINNQKIVIANSVEKVKYIEHHIYTIQTEGVSNVYYADIHFDSKNNISQFTITQTYQFPSNLLAIFKSYVTRESILYPNYGPTNEEQEFYQFFDDELMKRPSYQQNEFMTHMLSVFLLARNIRSLETKPLLQHFAVIQAENRGYSSQLDMFLSVDGIYEEKELNYYEVKFTSSSNEASIAAITTYTASFSPFFEVISLEKITTN